MFGFRKTPEQILARKIVQKLLQTDVRCWRDDSDAWDIKFSIILESLGVRACMSEGRISIWLLDGDFLCKDVPYNKMPGAEKLFGMIYEELVAKPQERCRQENDHKHKHAIDSLKNKLS